MLKDNIKEIEERIQAACDRAGRNRDEITLIAVSKTKPASLILEAYELGMRHFGENKVQELSQKYEELKGTFQQDAFWHQIGHLQRNKVKYIIGKAVLIHSVDSLRLAEQIETEAAKVGLICDILIEVNIAREESKFGVMEEDVLPLINEIQKLPHIRIRGLMTVAPYTDNSENNRKFFKKLRELYVDIKTKNNDNGYDDKYVESNVSERFDREAFNILSMGMTGDFEVAIEEGATMVRIGTGIFGERVYHQ